MRKLLSLVFVSLILMVSCTPEEEVAVAIKVGVTAKKINADGSVGADLDLKGTNQLSAGDKVRFGYKGESGSPEKVTITFDGGDPASVTFTKEEIAAGKADAIDVTYKTVGTFAVKASAVGAEGTVADELALADLINVTKAQVVVSLTGNVLNIDGSKGTELTIAESADNKVQLGYTVLFKSAVSGGDIKELKYAYTLNDTVSFERVYNADQIASGEADTASFRVVDAGFYSISVTAVAANDNIEGAALSYGYVISGVAPEKPVTVSKSNIMDGKVAVTFSNDIDAASLNAADFKVSIKNPKLGEAAVMVDAASVTLADGKANVVLVELKDQSIYATDEVSVSYKMGSLASKEGVYVGGFKNAGVEVIIIPTGNNILDGSNFDFGLENSTASDWNYLWWGGQWVNYSSAISDAEYRSGSKSLMVTMPADTGAMIMGHMNFVPNETTGQNDQVYKTFTVEAGKKYQVGAWIKVTKMGNIDTSGEVPNLIAYANVATDWGVGRFNFTASTPQGEWFFAQFDIREFSADGLVTGLMFRGMNSNHDSELEFYIDDFSIVEVADRP